MKIAIDCRYLGKSGIGRVCEGVLDNLDFQSNEYYLIGDPEKLKKYNAQIIEDLTSPFSVKGLFSFDKSLNKQCDCIIIPNFIVPFGIKIPVLSIIHDLIFLDLKVSTKGFVDYQIKKFLLKRCVKKSKFIDCVSNFTKERCLHYYPKYTDKFFVNYNGMNKNILGFKIDGIQKQNKIVYVGNVKPHKGLPTLIEAYKKLPQNNRPVLKIIGEKENFLNGLNTESLQADGVEFTGRLSDQALNQEIAEAKFLISPSLYEGFGLPPMEALYLGTKPIISDIDVHKEVYRDFDVVFFKTGNSEDLKDKILNSSSSVNTTREQILKTFDFKQTTDNITSYVKLILMGSRTEDK